MKTEKVIKALRRLMQCPDLNLDDLEEETILALAEAMSVVKAYGRERKDTIEGYPYLPVDKIPGYRNTVKPEMVPGYKKGKK